MDQICFLMYFLNLNKTLFILKRRPQISSNKHPQAIPPQTQTQISNNPNQTYNKQTPNPIDTSLQLTPTNLHQITLFGFWDSYNPTNLHQITLFGFWVSLKSSKLSSYKEFLPTQINKTIIRTKPNILRCHYKHKIAIRQ